MQPAVYANRMRNNAIFMIVLMVSMPALTLQTGLLNKDSGLGEELDDLTKPSSTGASTLPDCELGSVNVTEVYHYSSDWIEISNGGSADCDLGGWHIRDDDTSSGMVLSNGTNITAGGFMLFSYDDGDFYHHYHHHGSNSNISNNSTTTTNNKK